MQWNFVTSNKRFAPFFWTQFGGAFNDNFFKNALVVLVAFRGVQLLGLDSASLVAVASGLFICPFFLFSPIAGQICDKYEKSQIIRGTKLWEVVIMLFAAIGFLLQSYEVLLGILFLMGMQSAFFGPVKYSVIPELVKDSQLVTANAFIELGTFLSILLGTIAGGGVTALPQADLFIALGLVVFALFGYYSARQVPEVGVGASDLTINWNPLPEYASLWRILYQNKSLLTAVLAISWFWFYGAGVLSVLPIYVKEFLQGDETVVTLFLSMFTLGVGVGSMLCERFSGERAELGLVPVGGFGLSLFIVDLYVVGNPWESASVTLTNFVEQGVGWRMMFDFFMMSIFGGIFIVPLYTLLQERSKVKTRSRVIAAMNVMSALFMVGASLILLVFYHWSLQPHEIFLVFSLMNGCALLGLLLIEEYRVQFLTYILRTKNN